MFMDGEGKHTASCVFDPGICLRTCCVHTSLYCNFKKETKRITKTKMGRGEGGGGDIMTTGSFAYMLACGNK